jgi:hypothetical protein
MAAACAIEPRPDQHTLAVDRVGLHDLALDRVQLARLVEDVMRDVHLADVVKHRVVPEPAGVALAVPHAKGDLLDESTDAQDVVAGVGVVGLGAPGEREDGVGMSALRRIGPRSVSTIVIPMTFGRPPSCMGPWRRARVRRPTSWISAPPPPGLTETERIAASRAAHRWGRTTISRRAGAGAAHQPG